VGVALRQNKSSTRKPPRPQQPGRATDCQEAPAATYFAVTVNRPHISHSGKGDFFFNLARGESNPGLLGATNSLQPLGCSLQARLHLISILHIHNTSHISLYIHDTWTTWPLTFFPSTMNP